MRLLSVFLCAGILVVSGACAAPTAFETTPFDARDGLTLAGRTYGSGTTAIVLAHMGEPDSSQSDWAPLAEHLARSGHRVLTFNRAGVCGPAESECSARRGGQQNGWADVLAAVDHLRETGATRIFVGGASLGAMAALRATQEEPDAISGVFWFAGGLRGGGYDFNEEDVAQVAVPLLLVIATNDPLVQPRTVELLAEWATAPTQVLMLESDLHGTDVLEAGGTPAQQVLDSVTAFLAQ